MTQKNATDEAELHNVLILWIMWINASRDNNDNLITLKNTTI